jgi:hypothetical protein
MNRDTPADGIVCAGKKQIFTYPFEAYVNPREPELDVGLWLLNAHLKAATDLTLLVPEGKNICHTPS